MTRWLYRRVRMASEGWVFVLPLAGATILSALVSWWSTITPSNARDWQLDVAVLPSATVDGDYVTLHNIRKFEYHTAD